MNILIHGSPDSDFYSWLSSEFKHDRINIFIMEGRPQLKGLKIVAQNLAEMGIDVTIISDNMTAFLMTQKLIETAFIFYLKKEKSEVICQIGSMIVVICAKENDIQVYCHPSDEKEIKDFGHNNQLFYFDEVRIAPHGIRAYVPLIEKIPILDLNFTKVSEQNSKLNTKTIGEQ